MAAMPNSVPVAALLGHYLFSSISCSAVAHSAQNLLTQWILFAGSGAQIVVLSKREGDEGAGKITARCTLLDVQGCCFLNVLGAGVQSTPQLVHHISISMQNFCPK